MVAKHRATKKTRLAKDQAVSAMVQASGYMEVFMAQLDFQGEGATQKP